jgi:malonate transporter and related proteins
VSTALLLLPDFLLICGGAWLRRWDKLEPAFWTGLERLVYFVLFPALLFRALASSPVPLADASRLVATGVAFTTAGIALSWLARPLLALPDRTWAACFQCGFRFNTYIALAAAARLGGDAGVALMGLLVGVLVPVVNVAAVSALAHGRGGVLRELARNPLLLACVAGIAWRAGGLRLAEVVDHLLGLCASAALPLGLLAVGAGLTFRRGHLPASALAWWSAVKLGAVPAVALVAGELLGLSLLERQVALALAAVPTAPSAYILAMQMSGDGTAVALLITTGTLLAALTLPLWLGISG